MFNWKKLFKKRVDPKDIPVLEDVVDDTINDNKNQSEEAEDYPHLFSPDSELTTENDEFIIDLNENTNNNEYSEDDNVVILSSVIGQADVDGVGIDEADIDVVGTDTSNETEMDVSEETNTSMDSEETNIIEIDESISETKTNTVDETTEEISDNPDLSDPEQLEMIVDQVVEQLKPEIELQLHTFVRNALLEKTPEEFLKSLNLDNKSTSDKS